MRTFLAGFGQRATMLAHFVESQVTDKRLAFVDQLDRPVVQLVKIIRGKKLSVLPVKSQPTDIGFDCINIFLFFLAGIRVVETEVAFAVVFLGQAKIQADALGVPDVQVAVGFGWKPRVNAAIPFSGLQIGFDDLLDKVERLFGLDIRRFAGIVTMGIHGLSVLILVKLALPTQSA